LVGERVDLARLADVPILAKLASQIASGRPERQHRRPGQEVVQRLLLDGVDAEATGAAVGGQHDLIVLAGADEAEAALPLVQLAVTRAQVALDAAVVGAVPVASGDSVRILEGVHGRPSSTP